GGGVTPGGGGADVRLPTPSGPAATRVESHDSSRRQFGERIGDCSIAVLGGVLIAEGRRGICVTTATHKFGDRSPGGRCPREPGMAEVVVEQISPADLETGPLPHSIERDGEHRS